MVTAVPSPHEDLPLRPVGLLEKLMAAIRPEFPQDDLAFDPRHPVFGGPACSVEGCDRPARSSRMCWGHSVRWTREGRPDLETFLVTTPAGWVGHQPLAACAVGGCRYGLDSHGLCQRHWRQWKRSASTEMEAWQPSAAPLRPPSPQPAVCRISYCDLWVRGTSVFCTGHDGRWTALGHPDIEDFTASYEESGPGGSEHIDLRRLPVQLRLEMQYALQCRHDEATKKIRPAWAQRLVNALADAQVRSLLDEPEEFWKIFRGPTGNWATGWGTFLLGARRRIEELVYGRGWEAEYPRTVWRLRNLGIVHPHTSTITFEKIAQPWLRDLAKRWARWRLSGGISAGTVRAGVRMVARFAAFLPAEVTGLAQVDRALLERYLADLAAMGGRSTHNAHISNLNTFLRTIRVHRWDETLPGNAAFVPEDYPTPPPLLPRAVAEHVMAQLEDPANLARWQDPARRLITLVLMRCGLRITDAINLPLDPVVHDAEGAPYLRYFNHKMKREALVPIDEELEQQLRDHQRRILEERPEGVSVLFPRADANLRGDRPISTSGYRISLAEWLQRCETRDELGRPAHITPHQFRHTLGTRLINKDVPQEVVRQILDHTSAQMTAHYARLSDTTVRRHWEKARKVNAQGETVALDPAGPLAEAAWAKQRLSRATQALPNGYCGLPVVQSCPHANSCLTCPMFITTAEFLPQHREQRQQTLQIISAAEARGQKRLVEMNRQVADNLEKIITSLEDDGQSDTGEAATDAS
ncbi:tyrosine-type recombinase/integrase [Streptomyces chiangmaiensis]